MYRTHRLLSALAAAGLLLGACAENDPLGVDRQPVAAGPEFATAPVGPQWTLYANQTPDQTNPATSPWEVGTRFRTSKPGKVIGFRFWRASGETGSNYGKLWTESGQQIGYKKFPAGGAGWTTVYLTTAVRIQTNTNYRVTVNTNTAQVKRGGGYTFNGPLSSGPLYSDAGYYGQPAGNMPTTQSNSYYFVDVIFEEDVPLPNLYVDTMYLDAASQVVAKVCNNGQTLAGATTTRVGHRTSTMSGIGWSQATYTSVATPAIGAGTCVEVKIPADAGPDENLWDAWADFSDVVYESNENDNYLSIVQ